MAEEKCKEYAKHCQERSGLVDSYILRPEQKLKQSPPAFYMSQGFNLHPALLVLSSAIAFTWLIHPFFSKVPSLGLKVMKSHHVLREFVPVFDHLHC